MSGLDLSALGAASRVSCRRPAKPGVLFTTTSDIDLQALAAALATKPPTGAYCMCMGTLVFDFELPGDRVEITLHHGETLRWPSSNGNVELVDPDKVMDWLSARGVTFVREEYDAAKPRSDESDRQAEAWIAAMPASLRPFFDEMRRTGGDSRPEWTAAIEAEIPDAVERARVLLALYGSGVGRWSGYPSWESVPEKLLLGLPLPVVFEAIGDASDPRRCAGAIRLFCSWSFRDRRKKLRKELPDELRQRLFVNAQAMSDEYQRSSALKVLGS